MAPPLHSVGYELMPAPAQRRLAGFRFDAVPPEPREKLPRMDIAVFVGFASTGPLDVPVALEEPGQLQNIFGEDLPLAWDSTRGQMARAHLGPSVRAFFRNGGRRCWVIRVADKPEMSLFPLPGLLELVDGRLQPAVARARAPGSAFDGFACATALEVMPLAVNPLVFTATSFRVPLRFASSLQVGDMLRLRHAVLRKHTFVQVEEMEQIGRAHV